MSAFDDLTLGEVEEITLTALGGKTFDTADPMMLAGAVMWITRRKDTPGLDWAAFKATATMRDIKAFSIEMEAEELADPMNDRNVPAI